MSRPADVQRTGGNSRGRLGVPPAAVRHPLQVGLPAIYGPALGPEREDGQRAVLAALQAGHTRFEAIMEQTGLPAHAVSDALAALGERGKATKRGRGGWAPTGAFIQRFLAGCDNVLAAVFLTLDNLDCYIDTAIAPPDFLAWLGDIVGVVLVDSWPEERQRRQVRQAIHLHSWRGTAYALRATAALYVDVPLESVEIVEQGGTGWSADPDAEVGGQFAAEVAVRIHLGRFDDVPAADLDRLRSLISVSVPAGFRTSVEAVTG